MNITHLAQDQILSDPEFNCRGQFGPMDVHDLTEDIKRHGLLQPILVQPHRTGFDDEIKFRIVAGHRRFLAWSLQSDDPIPAIIKELSDDAARVLNLTENLKRKNLNPLQEAKALQKLLRSGIQRKILAESLGVSSTWVQVRQNLLELPEYIQNAVAQGVVTQNQIRQLYALRQYPDRMLDAFKTIKDGKRHGKVIDVHRKVQSTYRKAKRTSLEIEQMIEFLGATEIGFGIHTRMLAWAAGNISTNELFVDLKEHCQDNCLRVPIFPSKF